MSEGTDDAPPLPADWRGPADAATSRALHGAGLGLYAFREVPLVGRARERDALWAALAEVHARREPRAVVVRGPSGVGKSRLVEWVAARAHEAGAATVLKAVHGPFGGPGEGLGRMLALQLQCVGLAGDEAYARVLRALADEAPGRPVGEALRYEAAALTEFMLPGDPGERPRVRLADPRERHAVLAGHLARVTARRPALVWLDDAMWGPAALAFARELLSRRTGPAALLVLTVRDDALDERPAEAKLLAELAALPATTTLALAPLADADHRALIRERLGLAAALVEAVLARAAGNPLFSLQVVGDWVGRGVLVRGDDGFALRGEDEALPADLHALWEARLERLLARWDADEQAAAWHALELAAALGPSIEPRAWAAACGLAGVAPPPGLALRLLEQRLAVPSRGGWAFVHGMLRETLERHAAEAGRRATHHRICAATLQGLHGGHAQGHAEEVARHFIAAGEPGEALVALLDANYQAQLGGDYERAGRALAEHEAIADRMGLPAADARRLRGRIQAVWLEWMRGGEDKLAAARARCEEIEAAARAGGHLDVVGEALRWRGMVARFERRWDEALAALAEAAGCFAAIDDAEGRARAALAQAVTLRALGRVDEAEAALVDAERLARARELFVLLPRILGNLAEIALQRGDLEAAEKRFVRALAAAEAIGDRKALGLTLGGAGDLALARDKLAAADEHYRRAEALFASLGSRYVHGLRLRRATLDLLRGETQAGHAGVQAFLAGPDRDPLLLAEAQLGLAVVAARRGEPAAFDDALAAGEHLLAAAGEARRVLVRLLEAAAAATDGARADRARAAATAHAARLVA
jgi:tetratricopeptide (TPR) repeat protein